METNVRTRTSPAADTAGGPFFGRALLVGLRNRGESPGDIDRSVEELTLLAGAAGLEPAGQIVATIRDVHPATLIGTGKVEEIAALARDTGAQVIVLDAALLPRQQRNLERATGRVIADRPAVILEIFARRATTREAKLQVELARVEYELPRLAGRWQHLSRQGGGTRLARGEGETQLEVDRRIVMRRASTIRKELRRVERQRDLRRKRRSALYRVSLIGYTNAGKTTLLNALTGSRAYAANQLFATLDPNSRRFQLAGHAPVICTDTVGFVQRLPHSLIKAFHSTLEEALLTDLCVYVIDASDPRALAHLQTTSDVVDKIGGGQTDTVIVLNKIDRCSDAESATLAFHAAAPEVPVMAVSARTGAGIAELRKTIAERADAAARS